MKRKILAIAALTCAWAVPVQAQTESTTYCGDLSQADLRVGHVQPDPDWIFERGRMIFVDEQPQRHLFIIQGPALNREVVLGCRLAEALEYRQVIEHGVSV